MAKIKGEMKGKKPAAEKAGGSKGAKPTKARKPAKARKPTKVAKMTQAAKTKATKLASNPVVAEVVAATLVAAAAAIRDPKKARQIAEAAGEEIGQAAKGAGGQGGAIWKLAMDVARRSVDALGQSVGASAGAGGKKKKKKAKKGSKR